MKFWAAAILILALATGAARAAPAPGDHVEAELVAQSTAAPGQTVYVALRQVIDAGWHTYWRNPGDSGQATSVDWKLPSGWTAGAFVWPTPQKLPLGPLMDYGYTGTVLLPVPIKVPADAKPGTTAHLSGVAHFLVCQDVCIPQDTKVSLDLPVVAGAPTPDPTYGAAIAATLAAAPKPAGLTAVFAPSASDLKLAVTGPAVKGQDVSAAYFYPYDPSVIDHARHQNVDKGPDGLTLAMGPGIAFQPGGKPLPAFSGVLAIGGKGYEISATAGPLPPGAAGLGGAGQPARPGADMGLWSAIAFAFLGGLVLNLMPCVFPVLSIKAASLAAHREDMGAARLQGLVFAAGVIVSFLVLAGLLLAAKAGGEAVGWGFQLQSPGVVAGLVLILLLAALNLSGVFEVGTSAQGAGAGLAARRDLIGAAFTGVLAVVVAAPCTAPFMAGAIGWALIQPPAAALAVFAALGAGLAFPFTLFTFVPALFRLMPKPGRWMAVLRGVLAFPMYASAAWLAWVFGLQAGINALAILLVAGVAAGFAAWAWGLSQQSDKPAVSRSFAGLGVVCAVLLAVMGLQNAAPSGSSAAVAKTALPIQPWSPDKVEALRASGKPVFVDFGAAWCITCQVNERTALATKGVADAFAKTGAVYLKADWTNPDPAIAKALADQGRSGVPLYLVYGPAGPPAILPQILTEGAVVDALTKAKAAG